MAVVHCLNMSFNEHGNLLLYKGHPCGRLLHCETFQKPWRGQNTWLEKHKDARLSGTRKFVVEVSEGGDHHWVVHCLLLQKKRDFEAKIWKIEGSWDFSKCKKSKKKIFKPYGWSLKSFLCKNYCILVKSTSFKADLNFISRLCSIYVHPKDLKKSQIMEWKRHHKLRISRNVTN